MLSEYLFLRLIQPSIVRNYIFVLNLVKSTYVTQSELTPLSCLNIYMYTGSKINAGEGITLLVLWTYYISPREELLPDVEYMVMCVLPPAGTYEAT